jgi:hypothetical protein
MLFDLLLPIEIPQQAGFVGDGRAGHYLNEEVPFSFGQYQASIHRLEQRRYIVVRLGLPKDALAAALDDVLKSLARASVALDISIRAIPGEVIHAVVGSRPDLKAVTFFPAGERPLVQFRSGSYSISLPTTFLSDALSSNLPDEERRAKAFEIFCDIDFESSSTSRYALLSAILELLADRQERDGPALEMIDRWIAEAAAASRQDLVEALRLQKTESIGSSIGRVVEAAALSAGCSPETVQDYRKSAREAYRKRSRLLHAGVSISTSELAKLRAIVRLVLTGQREGTPFTPIANMHWGKEAE